MKERIEALEREVMALRVLRGIVLVMDNLNTHKLAALTNTP